MPPASTTPAWARTGSRSGVRASASAAPERAASATVRTDDPGSAASRAASAAPRATVRMVPSTGRITAWRASSSATVRALASSAAPGAPSDAPSPSAMPRSSWERITPEFPRAPIRDPWEMALQAAAMSGWESRPSSSTTDSRVRAMLVPVSPSGTG